MKTCSNCKKRKPPTEFRLRKHSSDGRSGKCKVCATAYDNKWYHDHPHRKAQIRARNDEQILRNVETIIAYLKTHPCIDCNEDDLLVLEFDHRYGKRDNVANMAQCAVSTETLVNEIKKCDVRCANCHRRKTVKTQGHRKWLQVGP